MAATIGVRSVFVLLLLLVVGNAAIEAERGLLKAAGIDHTEYAPEGVTEQEAEQIVQEIFEQVLHNFQHREEHGRMLFLENSQWAGTDDNVCNTVIMNLTKEELRREFISSMKELAPTTPQWAIALANIGIVATMSHDIRVWKICARCSDFEAGRGGEVGCRVEDYGYDALISGLFIAPYDYEGGGGFLETTLPVNIIPPVGGSLPSRAVLPTNDIQCIIGFYVSSSTRSYTLMVDGMGQQESDDHYKAFLVKQAQITATLPLLWKAEELVDQQSDCAAAMAEAYVVMGYSEGGYIAVVIADALERLGKKIIMLHAQGGPYRISTTTIYDSIEKIKSGWRYDMSFFMARIGAGMSSTITDMANYGHEQDFLSQNAGTQGLIQACMENDGIYRKDIYSFIPRTDPLYVYNPNLMRLYEYGAATGIEAPCHTTALNLDRHFGVDKLCETLRDQDVVQVLEQASYRVNLCHSVEDELIPYENLPDLSVNVNLALQNVTGIHLLASIPCYVSALVWYGIPLNVRYFPVTPRHTNDGCMAKSTAPQQTECRSYILRILGNPFGWC